MDPPGFRGQRWEDGRRRETTPSLDGTPDMCTLRRGGRSKGSIFVLEKMKGETTTLIKGHLGSTFPISIFTLNTGLWTKKFKLFQMIQ